MIKKNDGKTPQKRLAEKMKSNGYVVKQFWLLKEHDDLLGKMCAKYSLTRTQLIAHLIELCKEEK